MARKRLKPQAKPSTSIDSGRSPPLPAPRQTLSEGAAEWQPRWEEFRKRFPGWPDLNAAPVYALPQDVIDGLSRSRPGGARDRPPTINPNEAAVERAFTKLCHDFSTGIVGVWRNLPVRFEPLHPMTNVGISTDLARMAGWETESTWTALLSQLDEANKKAESARHQQLAYTGWLTFNPDYQREKRELFESWKTLDFEVSWPLISNIGDAEAVAMTTVDIGNVDKLPKTAAAFVGEAAKFMRHWKISRMVTWDLPLTQGPLEHVPHGAAHHLLGPDQTTSSYPSHYDIPSKQNLRTETQTQQQIAGEDTGISRDFPLTHLSARAGLASRTENAFKLWLIEATANRRFPRRRGLATQLSCILENMLDCSADRIKQLRRVYRPYLSHFAIS